MNCRPFVLVLSAVPMIASFALAHDEAVVLPGSVAAADAVASTTTTGAAGADATDDAVLLEQKTVKSMFKGLRFDEDWSGLKDKEATTDHWFPGMKYVDLDDGWYATFGGQARLRWASEENRNLQGGPVPHNNDFNLLRTRLYGDLHIADDARIFLEVLSGHIYGNDAPPNGTDRQQHDVENLFIDLMGGPGTTLRLGRFEMAYGAQRVISLGDWSNSRRQFQGVMAKFKNGDWNSDVFLTKPTVLEFDHADRQNSSRTFAGTYNTLKLGPDSGVDVYGLLFDEDDQIFADSDGVLGGQRRYTVGGRYWGKQDALDYEAEAARQFGEFGADSIRAYMWTLRGGYTGACECKPRIGIDLDYASGDTNPTDGTNQTYNQLFPSTHPFFGYLDLIGRQNIISVMPNASVKVADTATLRVSYSDFHLASNEDSLYATNGSKTLTDATGASGNNVGKEIDVTLAWAPPCMAPHGEFLVGYSTFRPGSFVEALANGDRTNLMYLQYTFTF